jgi:hypothetical protein
LGLAFGQFLVWAGREARVRGAKKIFFLSREGVWFARHYEILRDRTADGRNYPPAEYLPVSRRSTYLASFESVTPATFEPMLAQYGDASVRAVLESVGYPPPASVSDATLGALRSSIDLEAPWAAAGMAEKVLSSPLVMPYLERHRAGQRAALLEYLEARDVGVGEPVLVADIGWRGSTQDHLGRLLPRTPFEGLYYHLQPYFVPQFPNVTKRSFLLGEGQPSRRIARRLRFGAPLEFAISSLATTTLAYGRHNGRVVPIYQERDPSGDSAAAEMREQFARALSDGVNELTFDTKPDPELALAHTLNYLENPPAALIGLFFSTPREESFGRGLPRLGRPQVGVWPLLKALVSPSHRARFGFCLAESGWPWALLRRDLPLLAPLLRRAILLTDARASAAKH